MRILWIFLFWGNAFAHDLNCLLLLNKHGREYLGLMTKYYQTLEELPNNNSLENVRKHLNIVMDILDLNEVEFIDKDLYIQIAPGHNHPLNKLAESLNQKNQVELQYKPKGNAHFESHESTFKAKAINVGPIAILSSSPRTTELNHELVHYYKNRTRSKLYGRLKKAIPSDSMYSYGKALAFDELIAYAHTFRLNLRDIRDITKNFELVNTNPELIDLFLTLSSDYQESIIKIYHQINQDILTSSGETLRLIAQKGDQVVEVDDLAKNWLVRVKVESGTVQFPLKKSVFKTRKLAAEAFKDRVNNLSEISNKVQRQFIELEKESIYLVEFIRNEILGKEQTEAFEKLKNENVQKSFEIYHQKAMDRSKELLSYIKKKDP